MKNLALAFLFLIVILALYIVSKDPKLTKTIMAKLPFPSAMTTTVTPSPTVTIVPSK